SGAVPWRGGGGAPAGFWFERGSTSQTVIRISRDSQSAGDSRNRAHPYPERALAGQTCLLLTGGVQSGRTSAPRWPRFVQIIFGPRARIKMRSGKSPALMVALYLQPIEPQ